MSDTQTFKKVNQSQGGLWDRFNFWKLAIAKLVCMCLLAGCASLTATLNGVEWNEFSGTQKFLAGTAFVSSVVTVIVAFLSDTMAELKKQAEVERKSQAALAGDV